MIRVVLSIPLTVLADECSLFIRAIESSDSMSIGEGPILFDDVLTEMDGSDNEEVPFCDEADFCTFTQKQGTHMPESGPAAMISISCREAYESVHKLMLLPVDNAFEARASPETKFVETSETETAKSDNAAWLRVMQTKQKLLRNLGKVPGAEENNIHRWVSRRYPSTVSSSFSRLNDLLTDAVGQLSSSYPRVSSLENLRVYWVNDIVDVVDVLEESLKDHPKAITVISIFRNSDTMREFSWYISACMHYSIKERNEKILKSFLSGLSPFFFVFSYIETKIGIHYPRLYEWNQNFLLTMTHLQTPLEDVGWHISLHEGLNWFHPELLLLTDELVVWNHVMLDGGLSPPPLPDTELDPEALRAYKHHYLAGKLGASIEIALTSSDEQTRVSHMEKVALLFNYLDKREADLSSLCASHAEMLGTIVSTLENIPEPLSYQTTLSILGRCKQQLPLDVRVRTFIEPLAVNGINPELRHVWVDFEMMPMDLVTKLANLSPFTLGGSIAFSVSGSELRTSRVPGGLKTWFESTLTDIFEGLYFMPMACGKYKLTSNDSNDLRGIGRFLGLYVREGFSGSHLANYIKTCSETESVHETFFFHSRSIRRGFYDVFVEGDVERTLVNGQEVEQMLLLLDTPGMEQVFKLGSGQVFTV